MNKHQSTNSFFEKKIRSMSNENVLLFEDDAEDLDLQDRSFGIITNLMVLRANGEVLRIQQASFVIVL